MVRPIARGGMAEVWEAYDQVLSRPVAIKVLQRQYASDEVFLERFRREAVAAARLAHPGVVATFDAGSDGPTTYMVMELVRGRTLRERLAEQGMFSPALAMSLAYQIADALVHAHRAGIIHRDIKPANILLLEDGDDDIRVKVADFGIAKAAEGLGLDLTNTGMVLGTPRYLSPEQVEGQEPDARADLYALGVMCFEMLTGRSPFGGETEMAMAIARLNRAAPRVRDLQPKVPGYVDSLVAELLATDPQRRTPSALVLRQKLAEVRQRLDTSGAADGGLLPRSGALSGRWRTRRSAQGGRRGTPPEVDLSAYRSLPEAPQVVPTPPPKPGPAYTGTRVDAAHPGAIAGAVGRPRQIERPSLPETIPPVAREHLPTTQDRPSTSPGPAPAAAPGAAPDLRPAPALRSSMPAPAAAPRPVVAPAAAPRPIVVPAAAPHPSAASAPGPVARSIPTSWPATSPDARPAKGGSANPTQVPQAPVSVPRRPPTGQVPPAAPAALPNYGVPPDQGFSEPPPAHYPRGRPRRGPGVIVALLAVVALIVAALLLGSGHHQQGPGGAASSTIPISSVTVWIPPTQGGPDNPSEAQYTIDGNPKTQWFSDQYPAADFGTYGGEGLAMHLSSNTTLSQLQVQSFTQGWAATTYVADSEPTTLADWGTPTDSKSNIDGNATFNLGGRQGTWVLFYITNTGRTGIYNQIGIDELTLS